MPMPITPKSKLPRLAREWYQGGAFVFWTHTFENRASGWLTDRFHARFREILMHTCSRYALLCPAYTLMPDHWHFIWIGLANRSDQRLATSFLREHLGSELSPANLQDRAHDHVLRDNERKRGAFESTCHYIWQNPVRAGLCSDWAAWRFSGTIAMGYPDLNPRDADMWERFWRIYEKLAEQPVHP